MVYLSSHLYEYIRIKTNHFQKKSIKDLYKEMPALLFSDFSLGVYPHTTLATFQDRV